MDNLESKIKDIISTMKLKDKISISEIIEVIESVINFIAKSNMLFNKETDIRPKIKLPQEVINSITNAEKVSDISDGYHTFSEIYNNRAILFAVICNQNKDIAWKSKLHSDGTMFDGGYFICGINTPKGQFTYHYKLNYWYMFNIKELNRAPEFDGHTAKDVERLLSILELKGGK